jgi:acetylornithine deacetylase
MDALQKTVGILGDLIAFPTVSADSNIELIHYIGAYLEEFGANTRISLDESGTKANLFATLGPMADGGIVLSGHSDVVPVEGQEWSSDPFAMEQRDGRLYGRGTCDMKGFIAAALAMAPEFARCELARPVHFAFTYDEEVGCIGGRALMNDIREAGIHPSVAIIGEPTEMRVIEGHKGCCEYTTEFTGLEGHGSLPHLGVNAVEYAVRYVARLMKLRDDMQARAPEDSRFDPPWTTLQIGRLSGGAAHNIIAGNCVVDWEMRPVRKADGEYVKTAIAEYVEKVLRPEMRAVHPAADIVTHVVGEVDGLEPATESEAVRIVSELTGANGADLVSFGTEAGLFQNAGISAVVCGPGSIEQAHKPDEFVSVDELAKVLRMLERLKPKLENR